MNIKRLLIIDRCLRDRSRQWSLDDLIEACSSTEKNSRRSVQADLELMRSTERGYSAPIVVVDKKYYIEAPENGEMIQVAITMTCPKTPVTISAKPVMRAGGIDFEAEPVLTAPASIEVSEEERKTVADMMRRLGL